MKTKSGSGKHRARHTDRTFSDARGIVIADGGVGSRLVQQVPRVRAFVYGEDLPASPTLPYGRWKVAS